MILTNVLEKLYEGVRFRITLAINLERLGRDPNNPKNTIIKYNTKTYCIF